MSWLHLTNQRLEAVQGLVELVDGCSFFFCIPLMPSAESQSFILFFVDEVKDVLVLGEHLILGNSGSPHLCQPAADRSPDCLYICDRFLDHNVIYYF